MSARHSTESENVGFFAVISPPELLPINRGITVISVWSVINFRVTWNNCLNDFFDCFLVERKFSVYSVPRWTTAWRVTDMNIPHIAAFTSRFFILSLGLRPYLCLTIEKTFSMCGTPSEFPEATNFLVLIESSRRFRCSWSSSVATSLLALSNCIFLPRLRTRRCVLIEFSCSMSPCTLPIILTRCLEHPRLFDAAGFCRVEELVETGEVRFSVGFDFVTILSSPFCSCILFAIVSVQVVKLKSWEEQILLEWLMLNKWRRLFHSSRVKFPLSICLRVDVWYQHILFGFQGPGWFCQITN